MKKTCFVYLFLLVLGFSSLSFGQDYSFIGIKTNDKSKDVMQTLKKNNFKYNFVQEDGKIWEFGYQDAFAPYQIIDRDKFNDFIYEVSTYHDSDEKKILGKLPYLKKLDSGTAVGNSIVSGAEFWFEMEGDVLLGYTVYVEEECSGKEMEERPYETTNHSSLSNTFKSLVEKYGKPNKTNLFGVKWKNNTQSLYYLCDTVGGIKLLYLNDRNINDHIKEYQSRLNKLQEKKDKKEAKEAKKLF